MFVKREREGGGWNGVIKKGRQGPYEGWINSERNGKKTLRVLEGKRGCEKTLGVLQGESER